MAKIKKRRRFNKYTLNHKILIYLILVITILTVYYQIGKHEFIHYDDNVYVTENARVQAGITKESITWAFNTTHGSNWHPLTWLSHMLDCQLFHLNSGMHHITSLFFHIANTLLLFFILSRITGLMWQSAFVAGLFALHPLHVESVAWIAERKDVLSTFFMFLTIWAYIYYIKKSKPAHYVIIIVLFVFGLMTKPMLVTLPFVLLLLDFWPLNRLRLSLPYDSIKTNVKIQKADIRENEKTYKKKKRKKQKLKNQELEYRGKLYSVSFSRLIYEKIPLFIITLISIFLTFFAQQKGGAVVSLEKHSLTTRLANALISYSSYLVKTIWPSRLAIFYPYPPSFQVWQIIGSGLILIFLSYLFIKLARKFPYLLFGWLWYLGTLVPVIGLVQVGAQSLADRYTYIPLIGVFIMIVWGSSDLFKRWRIKPALLSLICAGVFISIMLCTWSQVGRWKNSIKLFNHTLSVTENNSVIHNNIGLVLAEQGNLDKAIYHYSKALRIKSDYENALNNLGIAFGRQGKLDEAVKNLKEALRINPNYAKAHHNLGIALGRQGKIKEAEVHFRHAIRIQPDFADAHNNLGIALTHLEKQKEAIEHFREALRIEPGHKGALKNLRNSMEEQRKDD